MTDPAIRKRNISAKRKGLTWETDLLKWLRPIFPLAERLARTGSRDEGDIVIPLDDTRALVLEAKNAAQYQFGTWMDEAIVEAFNWSDARPGRKAWAALVVKRKARKIERAYVVMEAGDFFELVKR